MRPEGKCARERKPVFRDASSASNRSAEPSGSGGAAEETGYAYESTNNLLSVDEGGRTRTFVYDRLGRLTQASNPESGTVNYVYDNNGNLTQRTDARGIVTTIAYDWLNRPLSKAYSGGGTPSVGYSYDKLRLTAVSTGGAVSQAFTYTPGGRIATSTQTTDGVGYPFAYAYYMDGSVASVQYPSGRTVSYPDPDRAGRLTKVTGLLGGVSKSYVSAMTYNEQGLMAATVLGNALTERRGYNAQRLQPYDVRLGTAGNEMSHLTLQFAYCANQYSGGSCTTNNGNIVAQFNYANNHIEHYGYDAVNRLSNVTDYATPTGWSQSYSYDRYGNRWVSANGTLPMDPRTPTSSSYINPANNRLTGANYAYDAAGNQTKHGGWTLAYDAENRLVSSQSSGGSQTTYAYDGEGRRVKKTTGAASTWFVYDAMGELAAEYLATPPSGAAATLFVTTDHLGSTRLVTDGSGNVVSRHDYLPFGEEIPSGVGGRTAAMKYVSNAALTHRFTGKERDAETGLDYSFARYFSSAQGRFTSPDAPFADQDIAYPQSWNLYSYVRNNPLRSIDPSGRKCVETSNGPADDGTGGGCAAAGVSENGTITPQQVTVGVGRDEANLIMLQGIGQGLSSSHQIATIVSEAGQGAMMVSSVRGLPSLWRGLRAWWVGEELIQLGIASSNGGVLAGAKFAQTTASAMFSSSGKFAGRSVDEVANALRSGTLHPGDVPIEYAVRDGNTLILNTRSAMALEKAGIPRSNWNAINVTNDAAAQARLSGQLERNGLTSAGTDSVRMK